MFGPDAKAAEIPVQGHGRPGRSGRIMSVLRADGRRGEQ
jgi:hypothetical protein